MERKPVWDGRVSESYRFGPAQLHFYVLLLFIHTIIPAKLLRKKKKQNLLGFWGQLSVVILREV